MKQSTIYPFLTVCLLVGSTLVAQTVGATCTVTISGVVHEDEDCDTISNEFDNCRLIPNSSQSDKNRDRIGDACQDSDGDGFMDDIDVCSNVANTDQLDSDANGVGDACQDSDFDSVSDNIDNCESDYNPGQYDDDLDGVGNACDNCRFVENQDQRDTDDDGFGDACAADTDGDGVADDVDNCSLVSNPDQADGNRDGRGDACDHASPNITSLPPQDHFEGVRTSGDCSLMQGTSAHGNPLSLLLLGMGIIIPALLRMKR